MDILLDFLTLNINIGLLNPVLVSTHRNTINENNDYKVLPVNLRMCSSILDDERRSCNNFRGPSVM